MFRVQLSSNQLEEEKSDHLSSDQPEEGKESDHLRQLIDTIPYKTNEFYNWGQTVKTQPYRTFYPQTKEDISTIVRWTKSEGKKVRVSAYKHTWGNFYAQNDDILISLLDYPQATIIPSVHKKIGGYNTPFQNIELIGDAFEENGKTKHLCKISAATNNEQLRRWAIGNFQSKGSLNSWTVPTNVILVENTLVGTNAMICHGAGLKNQTLSDLVTEIEFINPNGEIQTVGYKITDTLENQAEGRELIKSAAGSFGQLGVVTELTLKLDQMTHARMIPRKPRVALAVPPPEGFVFPKYLPDEIMKGVTEADRQLAQEDFINRCENDYYSEWFWFSLHNKCYVNSWKNDGDEAISQSKPSPFEAKLEEVEEYLSFLANSTILRLLPAEWQTLLLSDAAMLSLSANEEIVVPLPDALHFRRGIHNMPVQDMEFEIPIPALPNGKPDWSICQRAWWDAIVTVYEWREKNKFPMRLPLEMRIMGGSEMTMAAQKGNQFGTCSIEVLTLGAELIDKDEWLAFMQAITDKWASYTDAQGNPLNIRPHWAKQWKGLTIQRTPHEQRQDIIDYIKEIYKDEVPIFNRDLGRIAEKGGYSVKDFGLFSTPLLDQIFNRTNGTEVEDESPKMSAYPPPTEKDILEKAPEIHELIFKAQKAHTAKEQSLAKKYMKRIKGIRDIESIGAVCVDPKKSVLAINSWFSKGLLDAQANEALIERKLQKKQEEKEPISACCPNMWPWRGW